MNKLCKKVLKKPYTYLMFCKNTIKGAYCQFITKHFPQLNARTEMKRQKQTELLRPVNIKEPIYFNEKMLWLKYYLYNQSPVIAQCYNKYTVRKYVESKGLGYILNDLYGVWNNIDDIPWTNLPEEFVIKLSNGYYGHVFKHKDNELDIAAAKKTLEETQRRCKYAFKISGDLFAYGTTPVYICERLLHSDYGYSSPEDYKFYCFNGVPVLLNYFVNRRYVNGQMSYDMVHLDLRNFSFRPDIELGCSENVKEFPKSLNQMIEIAKILSRDFPFVRVDLYEENGKPVFGELTFTPYHSQTKTSLIELGNLLDLSNIDKYYKILLPDTTA